jgi:hypothetical protein
MTNETAGEGPDVTEMAAVHRVFRGAFTMTPKLVGGVADGDREGAAVVGAYLSTVLKFLHAHHTGEDELMFPKLVERAEDPELVARVNAQHHLIEPALAAAGATASDWSAGGSAELGRRLVGEVAVLAGVTTPHLDEEEATIMPIVSEHITLDEWHELPGHALRSMEGDELWLVLGLVRDQMSQEQRDHMLEAMPPPLVEAWQAVGLESYKARITQLIG